MVTYLLTQAIIAWRPELKSFAQERVERLGHAKRRCLVLRDAECDDVEVAHRRIRRFIRLAEQLFVLHELHGFLKHAHGLIQKHGQRYLRKVLPYGVLEDLPHRHLLPGRLQIRQLDPLPKVNSIWINIFLLKTAVVVFDNDTQLVIVEAVLCDLLVLLEIEVLVIVDAALELFVDRRPIGRGLERTSSHT